MRIYKEDHGVSDFQIYHFNHLRNDISEEVLNYNKTPLFLYYPKYTNEPKQYKHSLSSRDI